MGKVFDVFLSYKSEDHQWVDRLKSALVDRGVCVWLDKDEIRPGDRFIWALERGLDTSRAVALVVTPESLSSGWVADEYSRAVALSNQGQLQLIPLILRDAKLPGFLSNREHVDFRKPAEFDAAVDRLVWPGITGKRVVWYPVFGVYHSERWKRLFAVARREGIKFAEGEDIHRSNWFIKPILEDATKRLVLVFDIFEERPARSKLWRNTTKQYIDTRIDIRERTRNRANEVAFVLYHQPDAWRQVDDVRSLPSEVVQQLKHYFTLDQDIHDDQAFRQQLRKIWNRVQHDLMLAESTTIRKTRPSGARSAGTRTVPADQANGSSAATRSTRKKRRIS
ncbi:toll/interleukin-1 receptor domain-containing protein [Bradyrhizobium jicamae]|nr:toll/interleukin-1 receptor domain-containing protein [Bradyrhizobium jicamae]MBR0758571.1 toll/interleukin-1 receptor domain-containing protein [Bradyrhizobium jicamae]